LVERSGLFQAICRRWIALQAALNASFAREAPAERASAFDSNFVKAKPIE
jgi:hypothetical protein